MNIPRRGESPCVLWLVLLRRKPESSPIMPAWVTLMPEVFDWSDYVRYGCGRNNYRDSADCVARASCDVKRVPNGEDLALLQSS